MEIADERTSLLESGPMQLESHGSTNRQGSSRIQSIDVEVHTDLRPTGSSWFASGFLVINAALGAGLLNFPAAYNDAGGITVALSIQVFLMVFIVVALFILAYCSDVARAATYQDVVYSICGRGMYIVCSLCIVLYCFGTCITFLIIIGDMLDRLFLAVAGVTFCHTWYMNRSFTMTTSCIILVLPMCFPKRIDFLKYASFLGFSGVIYLILLVVCKYYLSPINPGPIATGPDDIIQVFNVVPAICFGYQCHVSVIPIYSCMAKRSLPEFAKVVTMALIACIATYSIGAVYGYWTFGADVEPDILESYVPDGPVLAGIFMFAAKTYTTYPILLFCGRAGVESLRNIIFPGQTDSARYERVRRYIITIIWFGSNTVLALFIPNIGIVIQLLGCLAAAFIFLFPGICLLHVGLTRLETKRTVKSNFIVFVAGFFIVFGAFMFGIVLVQAVAKSGAPQKLRVCV